MKSPLGSPTSAGAFMVGSSDPSGSTNQSVPAPAVTRSDAPSRTSQCVGSLSHRIGIGTAGMLTPSSRVTRGTLPRGDVGVVTAGVGFGHAHRRRARQAAEAVKAIVQHGYGAPERVLRLEDRDRPLVGDDDVLVRVQATCVNTPDWITVTGVPYVLRLQSGLRRPRTPVRGTDFAGVVEAVGERVTDIRPGDEVFGSSWTGSSAPRARSRSSPPRRRRCSSGSPPGSPSRRLRRRSCPASPR